MNQMLRLFLISLFGLSVIPVNGASDLDIVKRKWQDYYKKATVATFYSATVLNGYDELKLAYLYLDSARGVLEDNEKYKHLLNEEYKKVESLQSELEGSKLISEDNLNYIYPPYSLMMGHRPEFNQIDEAEEVLIENLLEKVLNLNDPINKGIIRDNADFVLTGIYPFDKNLFLVTNDYFGSETGQYAIRYHEIRNILDSNGFERYKKNELIPKDLDLICNAYGTSKLLYIQILDQGSVIPNLYYKGVYLKTYTKGSSEIEFVNYYEGFRIDKSESWVTAIIIMLLNLCFTGIILFLKFSLSVKKVKGETSFRKKWRLYLISSNEKIKATLILILSGIVGAVLTNLITATYPMGINEFNGAPISKIWVFSQILVPLLVSTIIGYLLLTKLTTITVNSSTTYSGLIFSAILCQLSIQSYFEYQSEFFSLSIGYYLIFIPAITMSLTSLVIGKTLNGFIKGANVHIFMKILLPVILIGCVLANWFVLRHEFYYSNSSFIAVMLIAIIPLLRKSLLFKTKESNLGGEDNLNSFSNPVTWIKDGLNLEKIHSVLLGFLAKPSTLESEKILILNGIKNIGKSRLMTEIISNFNETDGYIFTADCSKIAKQDKQYQWFTEALVKSSKLDWFDKNFFKDRSGVTNKLESVVKMASSIGPVDVSNILTIDDDKKKSSAEITTEFLDIIEDKISEENSSKNVILVIDGFESIGDADFELLVSIIENLKIRKKLQLHIKFLLIFDNDGSDSILNDRIEEINSALEYNSPTVLLEVENLNQWVDQLISNNGISVFSSDQNLLIDFNLKMHIQTLTKLWDDLKIVPGDLLDYLQNLFVDKYVSVESNKIKLVEVPPENKYALKNHALKAAEEVLKTLETKDKKLLESAAHIGEKFDANILAEIWETSTLSMIDKLTHFEDVFIIDVSEEDNIYRFKERKIQDLLIQESMQNISDGQVKQMIIEYQKRIIQTILKQKDNNKLNTDILSSSFERCLRFSKIPYLSEHIELLGFKTAMKYAETGDTVKLKSVLKDLLTYNPILDKNGLIKIIKIFEVYSESKEISEIDFELNGGELHNNILKLAKKEFDHNNEDDYNQFLLLLKVYLNDTYLKLRNLNLKIHEIDRNKILEDLTNNRGFRGEVLNILDNILKDMNEIHSEPELECRFYSSLLYEIIHNSNAIETMPIMLKEGLDHNFYRVGGIIARYLSSKLKNNAESLLYSFISLNCLLKVPITLSQAMNTQLSGDEIKTTVQRLINNRKLTQEQRKDLNMTISRLRDYYSSTKDWDTTIWLSSLGFELSINLNDDMGVYSNQLSRAFANYNMKDYKGSEMIYWNLFEYQLKRYKEVSKFLYVLEGLLYCGKALNDYSGFEDAKKEMYDHLMILSNSSLSQSLDYSPYDSSLSLNELINPSLNEKIFSHNIEQDVSDDFTVVLSEEKKIELKNIISVFLSLSCCDEDVDEGEVFDLNETTVALATALSIPYEIVSNELQDQLEVHKSNSVEWNKEKFQTGFDWVLNTKPAPFTSSILHLLIGLAYADGEYADVEQELVTWAKSRFRNRK